MLEWAGQLAVKIGGVPARSFLLVLDDGGGGALGFGDGSQFAETKKDFRAVGRRYIFFDPFDAPEYTWMEWHGITRQMMEARMGSSFEESDFVPVHGPPLAEKGFPESWDVMF